MRFHEVRRENVVDRNCWRRRQRQAKVAPDEEFAPSRFLHLLGDQRLVPVEINGRDQDHGAARDNDQNAPCSLLDPDPRGKMFPRADAVVCSARVAGDQGRPSDNRPHKVESQLMHAEF